MGCRLLCHHTCCFVSPRSASLFNDCLCWWLQDLFPQPASEDDEGGEDRQDEWEGAGEAEWDSIDLDEHEQEKVEAKEVGEEEEEEAEAGEEEEEEGTALDASDFDGGMEEPFREYSSDTFDEYTEETMGDTTLAWLPALMRS